MTRIYLLDPQSDIFQSFLTAEQLLGFANRCTRNFRGRTLIIRNGEKSKCIDLGNQTAREIYDLVLNIQRELQDIR
jgi:hypothetical protein